MSELYLILHKVRGEPAFDIAQSIGGDADGEIWVIPTSGHRAYPVQFWLLLGDLDEALVSPEKLMLMQIPPDWPDHYDSRRADSSAMEDEARALLTRRGLLKPKAVNTYRRRR
jgi:hypothetical protein